MLSRARETQKTRANIGGRYDCRAWSGKQAATIKIVSPLPPVTRRRDFLSILCAPLNLRA